MNKAAIISPIRIRADHCNRLWVMDTGLTVGLIFAVAQDFFLYIPHFFRK
jgi:hypothetical protein